MNFGTLFDGLGCFPFDHGAYPPQSDSQASLDGIRSLIILSTLYQGHRIFSALPPSSILEASPTAISGRTSYIQIRLEFHP